MDRRVVSQERFLRFLEETTKYFNWSSILREAHITEVSDMGDQLVIACPLHEDWSPSMRLTKATGVYHCFSCGAKGTYTKFLWELGGRPMPYAEYCEQIYKAHPALQSRVGFPSLFCSERSLDPAFNKRRVFNAQARGASEMPLTLLADRIRKMDDTWENLVLSLTLLQQNVSTDKVYHTLDKRNIRITPPSERISALDLLEL